MILLVIVYIDNELDWKKARQPHASKANTKRIENDQQLQHQAKASYFFCSGLTLCCLPSF